MNRENDLPVDVDGVELKREHPSGRIKVRAKSGQARIRRLGVGEETTTSTSFTDTATVWLMTDEQARGALNAAAKRYLGISGKEFLKRWDAGEYPCPDDVPGVMAVASLIPLVRD